MDVLLNDYSCNMQLIYNIHSNRSSWKNDTKFNHSYRLTRSLVAIIYNSNAQISSTRDAASFDDDRRIDALKKSQHPIQRNHWAREGVI